MPAVIHRGFRPVSTMGLTLGAEMLYHVQPLLAQAAKEQQQNKTKERKKQNKQLKDKREIKYRSF